MGPTGVLERAWVLQGCLCVHGSYRGVGACMGGACMGPTGVFVRAWVLHGSTLHRVGSHPCTGSGVLSWESPLYRLGYYMRG